MELTGATVRLHLRDRHTKRGPINAVATVLPDQIADKGRVVYEWVAGDTANAAELEGEWQVTFLSGKVQTFPNHGTFQVDISPQVA